MQLKRLKEYCEKTNGLLFDSNPPNNITNSRPRRIVRLVLVGLGALPMSAESARQLSAAFSEASDRCLTERPCGDETLAIVLVPGIVCALLSIELGFKALIMENGRSAKGHNLSKLFHQLGPWSQNAIVQSVGLDRKSFEHELAQMSEAFVQWRYVYEYDEVKISIGFLDKLLRATQSAASDERRT